MRANAHAHTAPAPLESCWNSSESARPQSCRVAWRQRPCTLIVAVMGLRTRAPLSAPAGCISAGPMQPSCCWLRLLPARACMCVRARAWACHPYPRPHMLATRARLPVPPVVRSRDVCRGCKGHGCAESQQQQHAQLCQRRHQLQQAEEHGGDSGGALGRAEGASEQGGGPERMHAVSAARLFLRAQLCAQRGICGQDIRLGRASHVHVHAWAATAHGGPGPPACCMRVPPHWRDGLPGASCAAHPRCGRRM